METRIFEHHDYRDFLRAVYVERAARNSAYSLRAFAKQLGLSPAGLSRILGADKGLSWDRANEIAGKIGLSAREAEYFCLLVQVSKAKSTALKATLLERVNAMRPARASGIHDLSVDYFKVIADWYHLAILESLNVPALAADFNADRLAAFLGITPTEAQAGLDRLARLELIEARGSRWKRSKNRLLVQSKIPNEAMRKYYRQILEKALASIDEQSPVEKVVGTETFAFDSGQIKAASALTDQYLNQMLDLAKKGPNRSDLYQVAVQFFRVNPLNRNKGAKKIQ